jgi:hypothetical protein
MAPSVLDWVPPEKRALEKQCVEKKQKESEPPQEDRGQKRRQYRREKKGETQINILSHDHALDGHFLLLSWLLQI